VGQFALGIGCITLETGRLKAHTGGMDKALPKIAQLVADARTELKRLGIDTEGKRSDELLNMAREQRNNSLATRPKPE
jgi:hypothetical protein